ncbi:electron transporter RnfG [Gammaproteobacteria bacterium 50_400_T64]|nr:electron transporter RnfG [Gammaproteobacteria bacterium 50_400_T64]
MGSQLEKSMGLNGRILGLFALITSLLLAGTHLGTKDKIAESQRRAAQKALLEIIPEERHDNDILTDTLAIPQHYWSVLGLKKGGELHLARKAGEVFAIIVPAVAPDGYSGAITMIVGINLDGSVAGVRVLNHSETPGLGDKVELKKSPWVLSFDGKSLGSPPATRWKVKKDKGDFDQFTGATITPRAVVAQVERALHYFGEDKKRIIKAGANSVPAGTDTASADPANVNTTSTRTEESTGDAP